jgi:CRISPR-associated protein Cmx8
MMEQQQKPQELERLIYDMVRGYVSRRLGSKYDLTWDKVKENEKLKRDYNEKKEKLAKEAFLAIRSRTGADFIEYFSSTICSVPQYLDEQRYLTVSSSLLEEPERVRTLAMLALSANAWTSKPKESNAGGEK